MFSEKGAIKNLARIQRKTPLPVSFLICCICLRFLNNYLNTGWKVSKYEVFSGPHFSVFGLNTEIYGVISIQSKYGRIRTKENSVLGHFSRCENYNRSWQCNVSLSQEELWLVNRSLGFIKEFYAVSKQLQTKYLFRCWCFV